MEDDIKIGLIEIWCKIWNGFM